MNDRKSYFEKLQDPRWQKVRLMVFERDGFSCRFCGSKLDRLEVHHLYYVSGREPWEYPLSAFMTACCVCHSGFKGAPDRIWFWEPMVGLEADYSAKHGFDVSLSGAIIAASERVGFAPDVIIGFLHDCLSVNYFSSNLMVETWCAKEKADKEVENAK